MSSVPFAPAIPQLPAVSIPAQMRAGDLFTWAVQTQLAAGSSVTYILTAVINNAPVRLSIGPVAVDGTGLASFSVASAVTRAWLPGRYLWIALAFDQAGDRTELGEGHLWVLPDPAATVPPDPRSRNERILSNIRTLLEGKSLEDAVMYKIGTRELTKMSPKDLLFFEAVYEARVRRERIRKGQQGGTKTVGILFGGR